MADNYHTSMGRAMLLVVIGVAATWLVLHAERPALAPEVATVDNDCPVTAQERYDRSDVVVTATIDLVLPAADHQAKAVAVPLNVWKGKLAFPTMTVMATALDAMPEGDTLAPLPLNFQTGATVYLIYARRQLDGTYITRPCDGSRVFGTGFLPDESTVIYGQTPGVDVNTGRV